MLNSTGALLAETAGPQEALVVYRQALRLARQVRSPLEEAEALEGTARCQERTGAWQAALADLRQAVTIYQRIGVAQASSAAAYLVRLQTRHGAGPDGRESTDPRS